MAGNKGGRPSEFKEEYIEKVEEYLATCKDEETTFHKTVGSKTDSYERIIKVKLPTIEGFALFLNVAVSSLYLWSKDRPEFSEALNKIKAEQKDRLIEKGLSGDYNPTIAKLILSSNHGMTDRQDVTSGDEQLKGVVLLPEKEIDDANKDNE